MKISKKASKYWIHKFPFDLLEYLDKEKKLGGLKNKGRILESIGPNDKLIIFSSLGKAKKISFMAYTMVEEIVGDEEPLYKTFFSPKKLKLKGIKYFQNPIVARDLASTLDFVENEEKSSQYYESEYREISRKDFMAIIKGIPLDKEFPPYLKDISFSLDDFIWHTINIFFKNFKSNKVRSKREINTFIKDLKVTLKGYGINTFETDLNNFYTSILNRHDSKTLKNDKMRDMKKNIDSIAEECEKNSYSSKFWIHKFPFDSLKELNNKKKLAGIKKKGTILEGIGVNDEIIIFTSINKTISFFASTKVDKVIENDEFLYKTFHSPRKLCLDKINFFAKPIVTRKLASNLNFVENVENNANYYKSEFREISKEDFMTIMKGVSFEEKYPFYLRNVSFSLDDFIESTIKILYIDIKSKKDINQIEIKIFLRKLRKILNEYGIRVSPEFLESFYAWNAHKLGFKHNPSRDTDKSIFLFNSVGKGRRFSHISLIG